ncbi:MAG: peptidoglycan DD-metalloendopeptidase family protein [Gammaproteobacteria bacterium]|nr:peptidoglycan DD-metalloendopeptidase family protein [Gammaproteobacteria bacterium]
MTYARGIFYPLLICSLLIGGCSVPATYAPVINAWQDPGALKSRYRVQKDDTIYSIAWAFDMDYRDLARINHLTPPYHLKPGQTLTMCLFASPAAASKNNDREEEVTIYTLKKECDYIDTPLCNAPCLPFPCPSSASTTQAGMELNLPEVQQHSVDFRTSQKIALCPEEKNIIELPKQTAVSNRDKIGVNESHCKHWQWPATGKIVKAFSLQEGGCKGLDITGNLGDPVKAVAPGKVVYSGSGLRGYGNLVIIKHSENYLSAYAYNKKLLVKEGDVVKAGDEIGKMGQNNTGDVLLHFEIRRNGKPVNPQLYL